MLVHSKNKYLWHFHESLYFWKKWSLNTRSFSNYISLPLFVYLYQLLCFSHWLSLCPAACLPTSLCGCESTYLSVCLSVYLSVSQFTSLCICLTIYIPFYVSPCLSNYLHKCLPSSLRLYLLLYLSAYMPLSICPRVHISICLSD